MMIWIVLISSGPKISRNMGYKSDKQLQADYLEIARKNRQRKLQSHERTKAMNKVTSAVAVVLVVLFICYLAVHYR